MHASLSLGHDQKYLQGQFSPITGERSRDEDASPSVPMTVSIASATANPARKVSVERLSGSLVDGSIKRLNVSPPSTLHHRFSPRPLPLVCSWARTSVGERQSACRNRSNARVFVEAIDSWNSKSSSPVRRRRSLKTAAVQGCSVSSSFKPVPFTFTVSN